MVFKAVSSVETGLSSNKNGQRPSDFGGSKHSMMALQTIGGSSAPSRSGGGKAGGASGKNLNAGGVKIERSWKIESNSRDTLFPDERESEEHILGSTGVAEVEVDHPNPER